jgi:rod shape-determining protein MreC
MYFFKSRRKFLVVGVLLLIAVVMLSFAILNSSHKTSLFKKLVIETIVPFENLINTTFSRIGGVWRRYIFLVNLEETNRELVSENAFLSQKINDYQEIYLECMRLRVLMGLKGEIDYPTVAARVIGRKQSSLFETVLINKGSRDGISADLPVQTVYGVLGRVTDVSWNVSRVLLLVDYNSNIDTVIQRNRARGILQGCGEDGCKLKYVRRTEDVKVGDVVITSGLAGVFPKGLIVGTVESVQKEEAGLFQEILVSPAADVTKVEEVLVILTKKMEQE